MADDFADDIRRHDELLNHLIAIATHQGTINDDFRAFAAQQMVLNERLTASMERLDVTLARIETLLARLPRGETNGRDA